MDHCHGQALQPICRRADALRWSLLTKRPQKGFLNSGANEAYMSQSSQNDRDDTRITFFPAYALQGGIKGRSSRHRGWCSLKARRTTSPTPLAFAGRKKRNGKRNIFPLTFLHTSTLLSLIRGPPGHSSISTR